MTALDRAINSHCRANKTWLSAPLQARCVSVKMIEMLPLRLMKLVVECPLCARSGLCRFQMTRMFDLIVL